MGRRRNLEERRPRRLRRLASRVRWLQPGERSLLVQAPVVLPLVAFALRRWGLAPVQARLGRWPAVARPHDPDAHTDAARRIAWCVYVGAAYGPWPANCLQRSLVLWWFLRRRGIEGDLRIGVRRSADSGELDFHAWVEHDGVVLNDDADMRQRYATFDQAIAPRDAFFR